MDYFLVLEGMESRKFGPINIFEEGEFFRFGFPCFYSLI